MSRITVFDKLGYFVGDIRASTVRSWVLNAQPSPGECRFVVSRYDDKCTVRYLQFGQYILIRHASLPDWIGVIVSRKWTNGAVEIKAIQSEYILRKRNTTPGEVRGTPGSIFQQILEDTNNQPFNEKTIIPGVIYSASPQKAQKSGHDGLTIIQDISTRSGNDFDIRHAFNVNGKLYLTGNWYQRKGIVTNRTLREGWNIQASNGLLEEDIRISFNYLLGRGDASTDGTRKVSTQFDEASINLYGLNQAVTVFSGNKEQVTVDANTLNLLIASKDPFKTFDIVALNVGDLFTYLDVGNIYYTDMNSAGFSGSGFGSQDMVRLFGMEYDDESDTCRLVLELYDDETE